MSEFQPKGFVDYSPVEDLEQAQGGAEWEDTYYRDQQEISTTRLGAVDAAWDLGSIEGPGALAMEMWNLSGKKEDEKLSPEDVKMQVGIDVLSPMTFKDASHIADLRARREEAQFWSGKIDQEVAAPWAYPLLGQFIGEGTDLGALAIGIGVGAAAGLTFGAPATALGVGGVLLAETVIEWGIEDIIYTGGYEEVFGDKYTDTDRATNFVFQLGMAGLMKTAPVATKWAYNKGSVHAKVAVQKLSDWADNNGFKPPFNEINIMTRESMWNGISDNTVSPDVATFKGRKFYGAVSTVTARNAADFIDTDIPFGTGTDIITLSSDPSLVGKLAADNKGNAVTFSIKEDARIVDLQDIPVEDVDAIAKILGDNKETLEIFHKDGLASAMNYLASKEVDDLTPPAYAAKKLDEVRAHFEAQGYQGYKYTAGKHHGMDFQGKYLRDEFQLWDKNSVDIIETKTPPPSEGKMATDRKMTTKELEKAASDPKNAKGFDPEVEEANTVKAKELAESDNKAPEDMTALDETYKKSNDETMQELNTHNSEYLDAETNAKVEQAQEMVKKYSPESEEADLKRIKEQLACRGGVDA